MKKELSACQLIAVSALLLCGGCMTTLGNRSTVGMGSPSYASPYFGPFDRLWSRRTILLTQLRDGPGGGAGSPGEESILFPLTARATYMDSALIDAGFHTFEDLASMNDSESSVFRSAYGRARASGDTLFIWLEMRTSSTEDFLDLGRWTIFLQDGRFSSRMRPAGRSNRQDWWNIPSCAREARARSKRSSGPGYERDPASPQL